MGSVNKVMVVGHLGQNAELKYTPSGAAVSTLSVATSESWKDKAGAKQEKTEWHRIVVWGKTAEVLAEYLTKGRLVCVEGKLQTRTWEKDGQKRYTTEIRADRVTLLGKAGGGEAGPRHEDEGPTGGVNVHDEDIPY